MRTSIKLTVTCGLCAIVFLGGVIGQIGIGGLIENFPKMLQDENLDTDWISKLLHPIGKHIVLGIMALVPVVICNKIDRIKELCNKNRISVIAILYFMAFLMQAYIQRRGITWHCITYAYALSLFFLISWKNHSNLKANECIRMLFVLPTIAVIFSFSIASNQGNITSMYAGIFPTIGFLILLAESELSLGNSKHWERRAIVGTLLLIAVFTYVIPIYEQEATSPELIVGHRTVFSERTMVKEGPARGIKLGEVSYKQYDEICNLVDSYVSEADKLCIIDNSYVSAYGYLKADTEYSTYSPYGGFGISTSKRIVDFLSQNDEKKPSVVLINLEYVKMSFEDYLANTHFGKFLNDEHYQLEAEHNSYVVLRESY